LSVRVQRTQPGGSRTFLLRCFVCMAVAWALATVAAAAPVTVFFEDFEGQGARSGKQPESWDNPRWEMPRSADGKWWVMGVNYYGPHDDPVIARQRLMGNIMTGRRRWCTTSDFRTVPDPVQAPWTLSFKLLAISYTKGALHVRFTDAAGRGYGCMLALEGEVARKHGWKNSLLRWDGANEKALAVAGKDKARIPYAAKGRLHEVALHRDADGALVLLLDGEPALRAVDTTYTTFTHVGVSVEYETRMTLDDIKVRAAVGERLPIKGDRQ